MVQQKLVSSEKTNEKENICRDEPELRFPEFKDKWKKEKIGEISKTYSGGTPSTSNKNFYIGNIPFIKSGEINSEETEQYINEDAINNSSAKLVKKGDLLLALYGATSGEVAISKLDGAINQAVLKIDNEMDNVFQYNYFLKEKENIVHKYLQGGQGNLSSKIIKNLELYYPNINEQKKIANFLLTIDKKIGLLEKKHEKILYLKDYYYSEIFNIQTFDKLKIEYVTKFSTGLNPRKNFKLNDGGTNFYVTIKNFENGKLTLDEKCDKIDDDALNMINKRSDLKKDDLIFASIGRVGEVYLIKEDPLNWNINESVFSLRANKNLLEPKFLYCLMKSNKIQHYFNNNITGSTFKSIKMKDLRKTPIAIPYDIQKQKYIADFLLKFDNKEHLMEMKIQEIINFKKGLLQKMFI